MSQMNQIIIEAKVIAENKEFITIENHTNRSDVVIDARCSHIKGAPTINDKPIKVGRTVRIVGALVSFNDTIALDVDHIEYR